MCGSCESALRRTRDVIERYGWAVIQVDGVRSRPAWAYTAGLVQHGLPEFVVTGLAPERAGELLNDTAHGVLCHDESWAAGQQFRLADDTRVEVVAVARPDVHLRTVRALFPCKPLRALQLVWCDGRRRWPWSARFNDRRGGQPVLGPRSRRGT